MKFALLAAMVLSPQMQGGLPSARFVPPYTAHERTVAIQALLRVSRAPHLRRFAAVTPNRPYSGSAHISFWKTSFVLATASGGEAGVNFWNIHNEGHINVGFAAARTTILDCRLVASGSVTYKIFAGTDSEPREQAERTLDNGHLLLAVAPAADISVELWPAPLEAPMGFLGCDLIEVI